MEFKFALKTRVEITASGERGEIIARAQYTYAENGYLVRYKDSTGTAVERWWTETALA